MSTWALTCVFARPRSRRRGGGRALVAGAVEAAPLGWSSALEACLVTTPAALPDELHPGLRPVFLDAGFAELTRQTRRRAVVRLELSMSG
jgi:GNAT superfamily N-acetyltransferase